jgi:hypothetical protein
MPIWISAIGAIFFSIERGRWLIRGSGVGEDLASLTLIFMTNFFRVFACCRTIGYLCHVWLHEQQINEARRDTGNRWFDSRQIHERNWSWILMSMRPNPRQLRTPELVIFLFQLKKRWRLLHLSKSAYLYSGIYI